MRRSRIVVVAVAALGVVTGGTAAAAGLAASPIDGSGVIHGCYTTTAVKGGSHALVLRNAGTRCPAGTTAISWNRTGPAGPQGPQGSPGGAVGTSGTAGPGDVPLPAGTYVTVLTAGAVPTSGVYYVDASAMLVVGQGDQVDCILTVGGGQIGPVAAVGPIPNQGYETLPLLASASLAAGSVPQVACIGHYGAANTSFYDGTITATLINSATGDTAVRPSAGRALPPRS